MYIIPLLRNSVLTLIYSLYILPYFFIPKNIYLIYLLCDII